MIYRLAAQLGIVAFASLLAGCTSHLSRSRVRTDLVEAVDATYCLDGDKCNRKLLLETGKLSEACEAKEYSVLKDYDPVESRVEYKALAQTEYITVKPNGKHVWDVALTSQGQHAEEGKPVEVNQKADCAYQIITLPLSTFSTLDVTGILEDGPHAKANVTMNWKVTALGRALKEYFAPEPGDESKASELLGYGIINMPKGAEGYSTSITVEYDKYDDGWRQRE